jgi:hypothetical protein
MLKTSICFERLYARNQRLKSRKKAGYYSTTLECHLCCFYKAFGRNRHGTVEQGAGLIAEQFSPPALGEGVSRPKTRALRSSFEASMRGAICFLAGDDLQGEAQQIQRVFLRRRSSPGCRCAGEGRRARPASLFASA